MAINKSFKIPKPRWPLEWLKSHDEYYYLEPIKELRNGRVVVDGRGEMIMLSSYSYLGLLGHPKIEQAAKSAIDEFSTGTHGVRPLSGTLTLHNQLEDRIAQFKQADAAVVFSSGYVTNVSTISALLSRGDAIICDKLNHASIVDGCLLSGAKLFRFNHNDMEQLERCLINANIHNNILVVTDAVFSMDGDIINLPAVSKLCRKYRAFLMVDEAHSIGVLGKTGHGIEEHFNLPSDAVDIKMGSLSKTIPSSGGYVAGNKELIFLLKHEARGFVYSASLAPAQTSAALTAFDIIEDEPERISALQRNETYFKNKLLSYGLDLLNTETAIIPIICGENEAAWTLAKLCQDQGLFIQGIPSPVVPQGKARLRCIITASHTQQDIDYSLDVIKKSCQKVGIL